MSLDRAKQLIEENTTVLQEGESAPEGTKVLDFCFTRIAVREEGARAARDEILGYLKTEYAAPDRLARGPSYLEVAGYIGGTDTALRLFALGEVAGIWEIRTPAHMKIPEADRAEVAKQGLVILYGFTG